MGTSDDLKSVSRRTFLKASATTAAVAGLPLHALADDEKPRPKGELPRRVLGRTRERVSMLNLGTGRPSSERMLNATYDAGIRYLDTADCYGEGQSEKVIAT